MAGRNVCGITVTTLLAAACGCESNRVATIAPDLNLVRTIAAAGIGHDIEDVTRAQKPEAPPESVQPLVKPLDERPYRPSIVKDAPPVARIIATVNNEAILEEEVLAGAYQALTSIRNMPEPRRTEEKNKIMTSALTQIIERELALQDMSNRLKGRPAGDKMLEKLHEAAGKEFDKQVLQPMRNSGMFKTDEEIKAYFMGQGPSLEMVRRQWERSFMAMEYLRQRAMEKIDHVTTHPFLVEYYEGHPEEFKVDDNVVWQDLFIDASRHASRAAARAHAQALIDRARAGEDFATLAKQYDNGDASLRKNAEGIGHRFNEIRPGEAAAALFRLHDGEVGPLIEIGTGFHIVRVVHRQFAGQLPFDEKVQRQVKDKLRNEVGQREMKRLVAEMRRSAIIEIAGR